MDEDTREALIEMADLMATTGNIRWWVLHCNDPRECEECSAWLMPLETEPF